MQELLILTGWEIGLVITIWFLVTIHEIAGNLREIRGHLDEWAGKRAPQPLPPAAAPQVVQPQVYTMTGAPVRPEPPVSVESGVPDGVNRGLRIFAIVGFSAAVVFALIAWLRS